MQIAVSAPKFYSSTKNIRHSHPPKKIMAALDPRVAVQQILNEKLDHSGLLTFCNLLRLKLKIFNFIVEQKAGRKPGTWELRLGTLEVYILPSMN